MKLCINSFAPAQIRYLGKFCYLSYRPKWSQTIAGFLNQLYLTKILMNVLDFLDADIDSRVIKDRL